MCLYERKILNLKYLPTIKNGGKPKPLVDRRKLWLNVGCGWCEECRRKTANEWKIRLNEEVKENRQAAFVTLSLSPQSIEQLEKEIICSHYRGIDGEEIDINLLANLAVRRFTERWRKEFKKAPRHWIVTEIGHKNTERLHLHGIMWLTHENITLEKFKEKITEKWRYGNTYIGKYVNEKTANYIIKYITKLDKDHNGYRPRTFVSKGIGKSYIEKGMRVNKFNYEKTNTKYRWPNGKTTELPRYYKLKLWNEEEREYLQTIRMDKEEIWIKGEKFSTTEDTIEERKKFRNALETARISSDKLGYGNSLTESKKYIVTEAMKVTYKELIMNNLARQKMTKSVSRREKIKTYEPIDEDWERLKLNKALGTYHTKFGRYVGTTTESERKRNEEIETAREMGMSVQQLRLIRQGIITNIL